MSRFIIIRDEDGDVRTMAGYEASQLSDISIEGSYEEACEYARTDLRVHKGGPYTIYELIPVALAYLPSPEPVVEPFAPPLIFPPNDA